MERLQDLFLGGLIIFVLVGLYAIFVGRSGNTNIAELAKLEVTIEQYEAVEDLCGKDNVREVCVKAYCDSSNGFVCRDYSQIDKYKAIEAKELREWNWKLQDCNPDHPLSVKDSKAHHKCIYDK